MDFSEINIQTIESPSFGQNAYLVYREEKNACVIIDPGFDTERIVTATKRKNLVPEAILVTHGHVDHIAGVQGIRDEWPKCEVWVGEDDAEKLTDPVKNLSALFGYAIIAPPADRLLGGGEERTVAGIPFRFLHIPGHSRGHIACLVLYDGRKAAFVGDIIFNGSVGRSDFPDGDGDALIAGIKRKLLTLPPETQLYPGHGPSTTVGKEARSNPYLR